MSFSSIDLVTLLFGKPTDQVETVRSKLDVRVDDFLEPKSRNQKGPQMQALGRSQNCNDR